jgi:hypothetical protein
MEQEETEKASTDIMNTKDNHIPLPDESFEFLFFFMGHVLYSIFNSSSSANINKFLVVRK